MITIKDIAREAGVTHTTVSRALRGSPLISVETSDRIRKIATTMGYEPSAAARSLKTNRSQVLGVILSHIADPFFSEILQGIDEVAQQRGYSLFIAAAQHNLAREESIVKTMREHRVDGVIICSTPFSPKQSHLFKSTNTPIVVINNQAAEDYRYSIYHDDLYGSQQVVQHLIDLGHKRIAYLGSARSGRTNLERLAGFREKMRAARLSVPTGFIHEVFGNDPESGLVAANHFLTLSERPTAIFCFNDMLALGLLRGLHEAGVTIPDDCSLAGFDNISFSAYTYPPLTTFDQPKREIGSEAARLLLGLLNSAEPDVKTPKIHTLKGKLLVRDSTAPPKV